jgi:hypothetical protein
VESSGITGRNHENTSGVGKWCFILLIKSDRLLQLPERVVFCAVRFADHKVDITGFSASAIRVFFQFRGSLLFPDPVAPA